MLAWVAFPEEILALEEGLAVLEKIKYLWQQHADESQPSWA